MVTYCGHLSLDSASVSFPAPSVICDIHYKSEVNYTRLWIDLSTSKSGKGLGLLGWPYLPGHKTGHHVLSSMLSCLQAPVSVECTREWQQSRGGGRREQTTGINTGSRSRFETFAYYRFIIVWTTLTLQCTGTVQNIKCLAWVDSYPP